MRTERPWGVQRTGDVSQSQSHDPYELDLVVARKEPIAERVVRIVLQTPDGGTVPAWEPGAHVDLVIGDDLVRQYSLCGDPEDRSALQVAVLREETGRGGSRYVHDQLAEGDLIRVRGPRNHFPLVEAGRYLFIAGGIGITPILPMIARVQSSGADWRLVYGGRTRDSMAFHTELQRRYPDNVDVHAHDEAGPLDLSAILAEPGKNADLAVYCCGPEGLLTAVEQQFVDRRDGALHVERFAPKEETTGGRRQAFEVELAQTRVTLAIPPDRSILDVVADHGVDVPSSCREGVCGTCETRVLSGTPDHHDSLLTEAEHLAGATMMICVSRSLSHRLVLDL